MKLLAAAMSLFVLSGCGPASTSSTGSAARTVQPSMSPPTVTTQPSARPPSLATQLNCGTEFSTARDMVLNLFPSTGSSGAVLEVLDVTDPLKPRLMCTLIPADGGEFGASSHEVFFWSGNMIGSADLAAGTIAAVGEVPQGSTVGAYDRTHRQVAYTVPGDGDGFTRHLLVLGGQDRTLYVQQPIGGHGGPPCGPYGQLQFSPDGTELLDYSTFRPVSGPANLMVFKSDGTILFQQAGISFGIWAPSGSVLYFAVAGSQGFTGEIDSLDGSGHRSSVATGLHAFCWPAMAPEGGSLVLDTYDASAPGQATGGLPHLWRIDLASGTASQLTAATTSHAAFVAPAVVWAYEETPCDCGPGGASAPDGVVLAHDLVKGTDAQVDTSTLLPGIGLPNPPMGYDVRDRWFG